MSQFLLQSKDLVFNYRNSNSFVFPDINVLPNEPLLILGKSGVGKTTFLHLLAGIKPIQKGEITINNQKLSELKGNDLITFRSKNIGVIYQKPHFIQSLTALENLKAPFYFQTITWNEPLFAQVVKTLEIEALLTKKIAQLSLGEAQRLGIARAVLTQPKVILADEPTSSLDDESCQNVTILLNNLAATLNAALVIVTHDQRLKNLYPNQITLN